MNILECHENYREILMFYWMSMPFLINLFVHDTWNVPLNETIVINYFSPLRTLRL